MHFATVTRLVGLLVLDRNVLLEEEQTPAGFTFTTVFPHKKKPTKLRLIIGFTIGFNLRRGNSETGELMC